MRVALYIEGGGSKSADIACRRGFPKLISKAGLTGRMPRCVACGPRNDTFDHFSTTHAQCNDIYAILLVDSEDPVTAPAWQHLKQRDNWDRPTGADDDQAQLMIQCMETWLIADRPTLKQFFGQAFRESALPPGNDPEARPVDTVQDALEAATRDCGDKRNYRKGRRSFELLGKVDPAELRARLPGFRRLCETLESHC